MEYLCKAECVIADQLEAMAPVTDAQAKFRRLALDALAQVGILGLINSKNVGGAGFGMVAASQVVKRVAQTCSSTAIRRHGHAR